MVVDIGAVKQHIKPKSDITLRNIKKDDLIAYVRTLEHNYNVAVSFNENQAKYIESLCPIRQWMPVEVQPPAEFGEYIVMIKGAITATTLWYDPISDFKWYSAETNEVYAVTHWMPLPDPPKENKNETK